MRSLFRLFRRIILRITAVYAVGSVIGVLALDKMFGGYDFYLGMLVLIAPTLAWFQTFMLVPKNLDWLMSLPISKRNLLVLHYATGVFASVMAIIATVFALIVLTLIKTDSQVSLDRFVSHAPALVSEAKIAPYMSGVDIYGWMTALLMISFYHALSMSISRPVTTKRLYWNLWNHVNPILRWCVRVGWLALIAAAALARDYALAPFGIFVVTTVVFLFLTTFNTTYALGVSHAQRRRWMAASAGVAGVQLVFLFAHATIGVKSGSFDRRVASVMFLGPLSGGISKSDLVRLLEADIGADRVEELGEHYKKSFAGGKRIRMSLDEDVSFLRALATKRDYAAAMNTINLFDPSDLGYAELSALFGKLQPLLAECRCDFQGHDLLGARIHWSDALKFLSSRSDLAVQYGLLWARYRGKAFDSQFVPAIARGMASYSDKSKLLALRTLSVLRGRRVTFNDWMREGKGMTMNDGRSVSSFFDVNCKSWVPKSVSELGAEDVPFLNYCIRQRADLAHVAEIESLGWLEPPFDLRARSVIRKVLKVK